MTALTQLEVDSNQLTGSIPTSVTQLVRLTTLSLFNNQLRGTIPSAIGNLVLLKELDASSNALTGSIPKSISKLKQINDLFLHSNQLHGTLPEDIGDLISLRQLQAYSNQLTGSIPKSITTIPFLNSLLLFENRLFGSIPVSIGNLTALTQLTLSSNFITGTIPSTVETMSKLGVFYFDGNMLYGSLPHALGDVSFLQHLNVMDNEMSGSIPVSLADTKLIDLYLDDNQFTGVGISPLLLDTFSATNNFFFGNLSFCEPLSKLSILKVSNNLFTGTIPAKFQHSFQIELMDVQNNLLTGRIDKLFNATIQTSWTFLDVSNNALTGSIPASLFQLPKLIYFAAVKNCFTGSIPSTVCLPQRTLRTLVLDGLHAASTCQNALFPGIPEIHTLASTNAVTGTIPACLFGEMKLLQTLHVSGNGLSGSLPSNQLGTQLEFLSLSHNSLTGTIPLVFQQQGWQELDLSFNKLGGELSSSLNVTGFMLASTFVGQSNSGDNNSTTAASTSTGLSLNNNRLSGTIPSVLLDLNDIDMLAGNLFDCNNRDREGSLPQHDAEYDQYMCGSDETNNALISFVVLSALIAILSYLLMKISFSSATQKSQGESSPSPIHIATFPALLTSMQRLLRLALLRPESDSAASYSLTIRTFLTNIQHLHRYVLRMSIILFCIFILCYGLLGRYYSTYQHKYVWTISIGYLSGTVPAASLFVIMVVCLLWLFVNMKIVEWLGMKAEGVWYEAMKEASSLMFVGSGMVIEMSQEMMVNGTTTNKIEEAITEKNDQSLQEHEGEEKVSSLPTSPARTGCSAACCQGKLSYTTIASLFIFLILNITTVMTINAVYVALIISGISTQQQAVLAVAMSLFKVGCRAVVMRSLRWKMMQEIEQVWGGDSLTRLLLAVCLFNSIIAPCIATAFVNKNCFYYAMVPADNITTSISSTVCLIFGNGGCSESETTTFVTSYQPPFTYFYLCTSTLLSIFAQVWVFMFIFSGLVLPFASLVVISLVDGLEASSKNCCLRFSQAMYFNRAEEVFDSHAFTILLSNNLAIMLCFGVLFPPLLILGCLSTVIQAMVQQMALLRYCSKRVAELTMEKSTGGEDDLRSLKESSDMVMIEKHGQLLPHAYFKTVKTVVIYVSVVWGVFLWDMMGDETGLLSSIWLLLLMTIIGIGLRLLKPPKMNKSQTADESNMVSIELTENTENVYKTENPIWSKNTP